MRERPARDDEQLASTVAATDALCHAVRHEWADAHRRGVAAGSRFGSGATLAAHAAVRQGDAGLLDWALVDRLVHRSELVAIEGESFRLKEAKERAAARRKRRPRRPTKATQTKDVEPNDS